MFDKAFENYHVYTVINKDDYIKTIPVLNGKKDKIQLSAQSDINIVIRKDKTDKVNTEYNLPDYIEAPVRYGQIIGSVSILINDKEYKKVNLCLMKV